MSFKKISLPILALFIGSCSSSLTKTNSSDKNQTKNDVQANSYLQDIRQFTFAGLRSGEGYFSHDGRYMIFQSEREKPNPFYQIYLTDLKEGRTTRVSPGIGKTTCAWVHPSNKKVMFSSTHKDPQVMQKMHDEIEFRKSGKKRAYSWDYDETYDIYETDIKGNSAKNLTHTLGYDAEGNYSPDGNWIAFASNRTAYNHDKDHELSSADQEKLKQDPSYFMDIYLMKADGSEVTQLTTGAGYDGGPFFSPDSKRIVWRHFAPDGMTAEIYTMNLDGSDQKQLTHLNKMSWAPFYHPSGDYIIFTSNQLGFENFELYIVDTAGKSQPVRVSYLDDFDGLPVFSPNGESLFWTRRSQGFSQIFSARWNDALARKSLNLQMPIANTEVLASAEHTPKFSSADFLEKVKFLASKEMKGRRTGSPEEKIYHSWIEKQFSELGLKPFEKSGYENNFSFFDGSTLGSNNKIMFLKDNQVLPTNFKVSTDWNPLAYSKAGTFAYSEVVFAGFGLVAPATASIKKYDSFADIDVRGKWVLIFKGIPSDASSEQRVHYNRYAKIAFKVMLARERGAAGVVVVNDLDSSKDTPLSFDSSDSTEQLSLPVLTLSRDSAEKIFADKDFNFKDSWKKLSDPTQLASFNFKNLKISAGIDIRRRNSTASNIIGVLDVPGAKTSTMIGAHGDHLGVGASSSSLMDAKSTDQIHYGADDNASGVAGVLQLAQYFSEYKKSHPGQLKKNLIFAVWSGEEIGVIGSNAFVEEFQKNNKSVFPAISSYLNMDMIGRYDTHQNFSGLIVQATGSSTYWPELIEEAAQSSKLSLTTNEDPYVPTDGMAFYLKGVPSLTFFTGAHADYHKPSDTYEKINSAAATEVVELVADLALRLSDNAKTLDFRKVENTSATNPHRGGFRVYLGTIPDYASKGITGLLLSGVVKGGPAESAGLQAGDVIINFNGHKIENIYDYVYSLEEAKPNAHTKISVLRKGELKELGITPTSKE